jgi:hypothetical protein
VLGLGAAGVTRPANVQLAGALADGPDEECEAAASSTVLGAVGSDRAIRPLLTAGSPNYRSAPKDSR